MLEKMASFFESRLAGYDEHMLKDIVGASEFYPFTASCLPVHVGAAVLDLGCGTGLELEYYFNTNPAADVLGIDLSQGMLNEMLRKFPDKSIRTVCGSYFELPLGNGIFDAAVSVESLHHFTKDEKIYLYSKLHCALKNDGYFILTDYFASSDDEEAYFKNEYLRLKKENGIVDTQLYHFDTPLTVSHEIDALASAGFAKIELLGNWGAAYTIRAGKM